MPDKQIDTMKLAKQMSSFHVPGVSIAVINEGKLAWTRGYGLAAADQARPVDELTLFQACSLSKYISATAALCLVQQGHLDLDEPVNVRLTSWQIPGPGGDSVTLRHLLTHHSGLRDPDGMFDPLLEANYPSLTDLLAGRRPGTASPLLAPVEPPGTSFEYSDAGYCIIELLLEDISGESFANLARRLVCSPLGMERSCFSQPLPPDLLGQAARGHDPQGRVVPEDRTTYPFLAAAGLWTTPGELAPVLLELQAGLNGQGRLLSSELSWPRLTSPSSAEVGMGFFLDRAQPAIRIYHYGWGTGFQCAFMFYPLLGKGAVVMTNSNPGQHQERALVGAVMREVARIYSWPGY
ncbi:MAG: serine hydrolase domain-containing protein [Bacillota bacterium]